MPSCNDRSCRNRADHLPASAGPMARRAMAGMPPAGNHRGVGLSSRPGDMADNGHVRPWFPPFTRFFRPARPAVAVGWMQSGCPGGAGRQDCRQTRVARGVS